MNEHHDVGQLVKLAGRRPAVPDDVAARVRANVRDAWRSEIDAQRTRRRFMVAAPLAAAASIAIIVTFLIARPETTTPVVAPVPVASVDRVVGDVRANGNPIVESGQIARSTTITTADGRAALRMTDGTSLRVDAHTGVRLAGAKLFVLQSGAIYVDAAHSGLAVRTPFGTVRDIGTKFEVRVSETTTRVRVRDGEIAIADHHARRGDQIEVAADHISQTRITTWGDDWTWLNDVAPGFAIEGRRVAEFVTWFAAESGMEVRYDSTETSHKAANAVLHGSIGTLRPVAAAGAVLPTAGLHGDVKDGVMTVRQQ